MKNTRNAAAALLICAAIFASSACNGSKPAETSAKEETKTTPAATSPASETEASTDASEKTPASSESSDEEWNWDDDDGWNWGGTENVTNDPIDPKAVDFSNIDITVGWNDSDTMSEIAANMWYGTYDGKVIKVDGINDLLGSYSIMERDSDSSKIGFSWELVGSEDYPPDMSRVELIGVISPKGDDWGSRTFLVLPENVKVISETIPDE